MAEAPGPPENLNVLLSGPSKPTKKCNNCGKWHAETHEVKGLAVLYSKCGPCREKHNKTSHAKRNKRVAEERAIVASGATLEHKTCMTCSRTLEISAFPTNADGVLYSKCGPCHDAHVEYGRSAQWAEVRKEGAKRYKKGAAGKEAAKRYKKGAAGKEAAKRAKHSDAGLTSTARYKQSDAYKAAEKRYYEGETFKAGRERRLKIRNARKRARYAMDSAYNLMHRIEASVCAFISGSAGMAGTFVANTEMSSSDLYDHIYAQLKAKGLKWQDRGITWEIEHKIPQEMYDFNDPEDVKRCWMLIHNVHVMSPEENTAKGNKLIDEIVKDVPVDTYPASWNGVYPATEEAKQAKYAAIKAKKAVYNHPNVYGPYLEAIEKEIVEKAAEPTASSSKAAGKRKAESSYVPPASTTFIDSSDDE